MKPFLHRSTRILFRQLTLALLGSTAAIFAATDESDSSKNEPMRLEEVEVSTSRTSAAIQAPFSGNLQALQPQTTLGLYYISNSVAPTADYATIANLAPSVSNVETNGPGLSEAKHTTIRGFDDGSYNVTMDGIPFGDYNTFTHHTTSYFPAKLIGEITVDRGPGTASTIGNATFGGTMGLHSKDPRTDLSFIPTLNFGSFNTQLGHFEANTGLIDGLNGASAIASYQHMSTDGYRTNSDMVRDTYYLKYLQPIGKATTLTLMSSVNTIKFGNPGTVTQQQIDLLGRNFGLKDNTAANALDVLNRRYNYQNKSADFEYIGLKTDLGSGWKIDNKAYTYSYSNTSHEKPKAGSGAAAGTMLGSIKFNGYRTYGDTFALSNESSFGTFKTGLWYDYSTNKRYTYGVNYDTTGASAIDETSTALYKAAAPGGNPLTLPGAAYYNYKYHLIDNITSFQPFAEYEWRATPDLRINGGVKYMEFTRDFSADVNQTSGRQALKAKRTDSATMPSISAHYTFTKEWSAYAQFAKGFQAPSEANSFYVDSANVGNIAIRPETTTNYQVGTVYKQDRFTADVDAYYIDFQNYAYNGPSDASGDPLYYGIAKGAVYRGLEAEATYYVGGGLSAYVNGSINRAVFKNSHLDVPQVPDSTAALGFVYDHQGFFTSFSEKYVGCWTVYDNITNPDVQGGGASRTALSSSYWIGDLAIGYGRKFEHSFIKSAKVRLQVGNVFDKKVQVLDSIDANPANAYTKDAFNVLPVRSYFLTVSGEF